MSKIIAHIDLNAFFASAEEARNPSLIGKPLIVSGPNSRSVVSTANYEARKYGIHSAMPTFEALKLCRSLIVLPCDYKYYEMLSNSFFTYLKRITPILEIASIDECYLDMSEVLKNEKDPLAYLSNLQNNIYKDLSLKCSIGISITKFLAKMASDMKKPMGITILRKKDLNTLLYPLPIESFYGIGSKTAAKLKKIGIRTINDFKIRSDQNDKEIINILGKFYLTAKKWVNGEGDDYVNPTPSDPKSIGRSQTFLSDTNNYEEIYYKIEELSMAVALAANRENKKGKTISLIVKDNEFHMHDKSITLNKATNDPTDIFEVAMKLYENNFLGDIIRLVGVSLSQLINPNDEIVQMSFWNYNEYEKMDKTKLLINELNRQYKKEVLYSARKVKNNGNKKG